MAYATSIFEQDLLHSEKLVNYCRDGLKATNIDFFMGEWDLDYVENVVRNQKKCVILISRLRNDFPPRASFNYYLSTSWKTLPSEVLYKENYIIHGVNESFIDKVRLEERQTGSFFGRQQVGIISYYDACFDGSIARVSSLQPAKT